MDAAMRVKFNSIQIQLGGKYKVDLASLDVEKC